MGIYLSSKSKHSTEGTHALTTAISDNSFRVFTLRGAYDKIHLFMFFSWKRMWHNGVRSSKHPRTGIVGCFVSME